MSHGPRVGSPRRAAEIGAQARFARANERGGVAGRRVRYVGTEHPLDASGATAAVGRLASQVFAVVPAASPVLDTAALEAAQLPFFGPAEQESWTGVSLGFGVAGAQVAAPSREVSPAWGITLRALYGGARGRRLAGALAAAGYTGTVATGPAAYLPDAPATGRGLTVLLPYAPPEQPTPANRRLAADVERFAPGTVVTPGVVAGYWAADAFLAGLAAAGRRAAPARIGAALRRLDYSVPGTVGPTRFPEAHSQPAPCGSLAQGDGTTYLVPVTYRCGRLVPLRAGRPSPP